MPALDGVRGIAITLVLFYHFAIYSGFQTSMAGVLDQAIFRVVTVGWSGVDLFFVLSGFLITGILYETKGDERYFRNFYMRRVLRIFPLYYGTLFVFFFVAPHLIWMGDQFAAVQADQLWFWTYLINIKMAISGWPAQVDLGHFWSLAIEEQFYVVWPLVVFLANRKTLIRICLFCIALALGLRIALYVWPLGAVIAPYVLTPARLDALAVGALIAVWARGPKGLKVLHPWIRPAIVAPGILLAAIFLWHRRLAYMEVPMRTVGFTILAVFFGGVLALAVVQPPESRWGRFFSHPALRFMGKYSYGLYVIHHIVIAGLDRRGFQTAVLPTLWGSHLPGLVIFSLVAGSISIFLALLSWYLWESQCLRLKRYFAYRSRPEKPIPSRRVASTSGL
jgi:peptidoglycan/LPS O-acetylase OafA/YrhL